jgi:hypothetical protein
MTRSCTARLELTPERPASLRHGSLRAAVVLRGNRSSLASGEDTAALDD